MNETQIRYEVEAHVARITLDRPRYRNAQSRVLLEELDAAFATAGADPDVHVVALFGAGDHFSAGHDLGTSEERADRDERPLQAGLRGRFDHSRENFVDAREAAQLGVVNRVVATADLRDAVIEYAQRVARNDPFQLRMMKLAVNQVQDAQGFAGHITAAHAMHILSSEGEKDPDYELRVPEGARRPMVERAFEHYELKKQQEQE